MKSPRKSVKNAERVLSPDVYDALELSALAFGGIGSGRFSEGQKPCCVHGHAIALSESVWEGWDLRVELYDAGVTLGVNDRAVDGDGRISFAEWCKRLNVVRADTPTFDADFVQQCELLRREP